MDSPPHLDANTLTLMPQLASSRAVSQRCCSCVTSENAKTKRGPEMCLSSLALSHIPQNLCDPEHYESWAGKSLGNWLRPLGMILCKCTWNGFRILTVTERRQHCKINTVFKIPRMKSWQCEFCPFRNIDLRFGLHKWETTIHRHSNVKKEIKPPQERERNDLIMQRPHLLRYIPTSTLCHVGGLWGQRTAHCFLITSS